MQQSLDVPMSPQQKLDIAERAMGQKNYVHARLLAEQAQMNAQASAKVHIAASTLHTDDAAAKKFRTTK